MRYLIATLALAACALSPLNAQEAAAPAARPRSGVRRAIEWKQFTYTCEGGRTLKVYLHNQTVKLRFGEKTYLMKQVIAASGTRYSDGKVSWWSKGDSGFLQEDAPDGDGAMVVKDCQLEKPPAAPAPETDKSKKPIKP